MIIIEPYKFEKLMKLLEGVECKYCERRADKLSYELWDTKIFDGTEPQIGTIIISEHGNFRVFNIRKKYYRGNLEYIQVDMMVPDLYDKSINPDNVPIPPIKDIAPLKAIERNW